MMAPASRAAVKQDQHATIVALFGPDLRRVRQYDTAHRTWLIEPRLGAGPDNRWQLIADPMPALNENPAAPYLDCPFAKIDEARRALAEAIAVDDGSHQED